MHALLTAPALAARRRGLSRHRWCLEGGGVKTGEAKAHSILLAATKAH